MALLKNILLGILCAVTLWQFLADRRALVGLESQINRQVNRPAPQRPTSPPDLQQAAVREHSEPEPSIPPKGECSEITPDTGLARLAPEQSQSLSFDKLPRAVSQELPAFPDELLSTSTSNHVVIQYHVNARGDVESPHITETNNSSLDARTLQAVAGWHYQPAEQNGAAVDSNLEVSIDYNPNSKKVTAAPATPVSIHSQSNDPGWF